MENIIKSEKLVKLTKIRENYEGGIHMDENRVVLKISNIDKSFGATHAVNDVSLEFYKGEIRGLIGENGSGKSTLTSIIAGFQQPDKGTMEKDGKEYAPKTMLDGKNHKICILVQEVGTINGLTVASNLFLGKEKEFRTGGIVSQRKMCIAAKKAMEDVGITDIDPNAVVDKMCIRDSLKPLNCIRTRGNSF